MRARHCLSERIEDLSLEIGGGWFMPLGLPERVGWMLGRSARKYLLVSSDRTTDGSGQKVMLLKHEL